ncbi:MULTISPECIES: SulP family inorganic anion transporter [unclassified Novosphingobium]|uniref:SulP family inorganic anion transporter n=1 Tax=unclassified Novosphingobium TaxID=2644732 RepID=UPI0014945CFB|nr:MULTISPECIES: SulP family inorganic anion transporter [unclassified Novosphingobium]MBB3358091.1 SulP family sulfate permease [Novosphingobium sp. BK256]MBB3374452.1 SulP family sulfate permease [Novosphingobium sp. BK280]MBB3378864.1 SulP family sulfate permease [Novosphingobium sp. BK258]MBB3420558.1 SulP family sulfate permease [Novosphingobium sp. BK267]MBB3448320.1 SulP family sulfate permease [Novosphingobium sp. BK352]
MNNSSFARYRAEWWDSATSARRDILAGMVGTFALIPEVIAFSFVAGIDPEVGLFASFVIGIVIAFAGGRPAMISGAAGSVALVAAALVHAHGLPYLLAATLLAGVFQIVFGLLKLDVLMRFVSRSVRTGFVNALAILIFSAQVPQMLDVTWHTYALIAAGLAIIYLAPRITTAIPSPLICIVALTAISMAFPMPVHTVADLGRLPATLPSLTWPGVPMAWETLRIVMPYALAMAAVGLLESMMTASVVDDLTETSSSKARECTGLGLANLAAGLFGGIAGCGMIGQTVGNVRYGGRGRLSTLVAGVFLLVVMVPLRPWVAQVPVAALVAIMIMVSISTFSWGSIRDLARHPKVSGVVMVATVLVTVATHDLAAGVAVGVLLSGVFFAFKVTRMMEVRDSYDAASDTRTYVVTGQVFFASADIFADRFDLRDDARRVRIDLTASHLWDVTAVGALEDVVSKMRHHGIAVELIGLNQASAILVDRLAPAIS